MNRSLALMCVMILTAGCNKNGEILELQCDETVTPLAMDVASPLGVSGQDLMGLVEMTDVAMNFGDDINNGSVVLTPIGEVEVVERVEQAVPLEAADQAYTSHCRDTLEIPVRIEIRSDDGRLAEVVESRLVSEEGDWAGYAFDIRPGDIEGTLDLSWLSRRQFDKETLHFSGHADESQHSGRVTLREAQEDPMAFTQTNILVSWSASAI